MSSSWRKGATHRRSHEGGLRTNQPRRTLVFFLLRKVVVVSYLQVVKDHVFEHVYEHHPLLGDMHAKSDKCEPMNTQRTCEKDLVPRKTHVYSNVKRIQTGRVLEGSWYSLSQPFRAVILQCPNLHHTVWWRVWQVTWSIISGVRVCGCARASVGPQNHTMQHMCRAWKRTWLEEERLLTKGCKQQWANARQLDLFQTRLCGLETINGLFV